MEKQQNTPPWVTKHLPAGDTGAVVTFTEDGGALVAGTHALFVVTEGGIQEGGMWYEVQYARWDAQTRQLTVVWVDPARPAYTATTVDTNPARFMKILTSRVDKLIVLSRQLKLPSGTVVTAAVRRRVDGELFSSVTAKGELSPAEMPVVRGFEAEVRQELGLPE